MIKHYTIHYQQGVGVENEDAYVLNEEAGIYAVIDGATGIGGLPGKLSSATMKEAMDAAESGMSLFKEVSRANQEVGKRNAEQTGHHHIEDVPRQDRSTCGMAAIKLYESGQMEFAHAGDCMLFIEYNNDDIRCVTYDHVSKFDSVTIASVEQAWENILQSGENPNTWPQEKFIQTLKDIRTQNMPILKRNRSNINKKHGYSIIDGSKDAEQFMEHGKLYLHNATRILMLSDGLQLPDSKANGQEVWVETAKYAFEHGLEKLQERVNDLEETDPACIQYPRLKQADDKTGVLIELIE
ncbi:PP2C family serine/threonine-protein phosphatase [Pontibacillus yanchengensis]|uniref:PPM-type phosphatase domain-containing protein n=1 Tax=Pontibacillus yanchengensis Y32 TaxID=1385514 RepID=A0A0A2TJT5_9BACI|nr:PP2C family serine/threonine-protein phosphatase [Pontibacillus yanchengensis]KGP74703.1 hypothetical protein N782_00680 [Pontibacillus yanchengensis Y32]